MTITHPPGWVVTYPRVGAPFDERLTDCNQTVLCHEVGFWSRKWVLNGNEKHWVGPWRFDRRTA